METSTTISIQLNKLTCPICCELFKVPKLLQCGHSFCQTCVQQLQSKDSCPVCRKQVCTLNNSAEQLPTNYALQSLLDSDVSSCDEETLTRSFGQCPTHENDCDQFCRTCEKQVCKQCAIDHHQRPSHDTLPVGVVVIQQREDLDRLMTELGDLMKRLKLIEANISESEKTCQSEVDQLKADINSSAAECTDKIEGHAKSLEVVVQDEQTKILQCLDGLRLKHCENFLLGSLALDLCQSLKADFDKSNLSRAAVMKRLAENKSKIEKDLKKLEGKEKALEIDLKFQQIETISEAGKLTRKKLSKPVATHMKTVSFSDNQTRVIISLLAGFVWPAPNWMIAITRQATGSHTFIKFLNEHLILKTTVCHEIGVDEPWLYVSHCDYEGKFILCSTSKRVLKVSLPLEQKLKDPGKIISIVFTPNPVWGIAWDEHHHGCYALLNDRKTLLHVELGGQGGSKEVMVFDEAITSRPCTQFFHVNEEGSMAICDQEKKVVNFFKKIESESTVTVTAPPGLDDYTPECVNTRRGEKLWYVMWKKTTSRGTENNFNVYDSSFQLIGSVFNLCVNKQSDERGVKFCFQGNYIAVTIEGKVEIYFLSYST